MRLIIRGAQIDTEAVAFAAGELCAFYYDSGENPSYWGPAPGYDPAAQPAVNTLAADTVQTLALGDPGEPNPGDQVYFVDLHALEGDDADPIVTVEARFVKIPHGDMEEMENENRTQTTDTNDSQPARPAQSAFSAWLDQVRDFLKDRFSLDEDTAQRVGDGKHIGVEEAAFCLAVAVLRELNDKGVEYRVDVPMDDEDRIAALVSLMEKHPRSVVEIIAHHGKSVAVGFNSAYAALYENLLRAKDRAGDEMSARIGHLKACIAASTQRLPVECSVVFR